MIDFLFIVRLAIILATVATVVFVAKTSNNNHVIWPIALVGLHIVVFFGTSLARAIWGTDWWFRLFSVGFANNWSILLYLHITLTALAVSSAIFIVERDEGRKYAKQS